MSGRTNYDCHQWFLEVAQELGFSLPVSSALSLGCGFGDLERGYNQYNFAEVHEGIDLAEGAVAEAGRLAHEAGMHHIRYSTADLNLAELPENRHDVVLAHQSVHHIERLEHLAAQVHRTLKPGGLFMMNEYVGLNRLQISPLQRSFADALFRLLPERYLRLGDGTIRRSIELATAEEVAAHDPSEAIRSEDIVDVFSNVFDLVDRRDYGGNLLHYGLYKIVANFQPEDPLDDRWLHWLFDAEDCLLAEGVPSDFAVLIYRKN
ncbi:MAG: class I SAM-dependent methyltransferase [Candidatus Sulfomarinibacteraceae bacterium]